VILGSLSTIFTPQSSKFVVYVVTGSAKFFCDLSPFVAVLFHKFYQSFLFLSRPLALVIVFIELPLDEAVTTEGRSTRQFACEYMEKFFLFEKCVDNILLIQENEEVLIACI